MLLGSTSARALQRLLMKLAPDSDSREAQCLHIVDDYYIPIFNYLAHQIDPRGTCALFGLCDDGEFLKVKSRMTTRIFKPYDPLLIKKFKTLI